MCYLVVEAQRESAREALDRHSPLGVIEVIQQYHELCRGVRGSLCRMRQAPEARPNYSVVGLEGRDKADTTGREKLTNNLKAFAEAHRVTIQHLIALEYAAFNNDNVVITFALGQSPVRADANPIERSFGRNDAAGLWHP